MPCTCICTCMHVCMIIPKLLKQKQQYNLQQVTSVTLPGSMNRWVWCSSSTSQINMCGPLRVYFICQENTTFSNVTFQILDSHEQQLRVLGPDVPGGQRPTLVFSNKPARCRTTCGEQNPDMEWPLIGISYELIGLWY